MTSALLRYPRMEQSNPTLSDRIAKLFSPELSPEDRVPVEGLALRSRSEVVVFTSDPQRSINRERFNEFFGTDEFLFRSRYTGPFLPLTLAGGDSIGYGAPSSGTGTAACVLSDILGNQLVLTCNHVIAELNAAKRKIDPVWSPGSLDGGSAADKAGALDDFEDILFGGVRSNSMDAAIAKPDPNTLLSRSIGGGIGIVGGVDPAPKLNMTVKKFGKSTGLTVADYVFGNMSLIVPYASGQALFMGQHGIVDSGGSAFAKPGDSGSLVVNGSNEAFGLLFAIASTGDVAVVNPIDPILTRFALHF